LVLSACGGGAAKSPEPSSAAATTKNTPKVDPNTAPPAGGTSTSTTQTATSQNAGNAAAALAVVATVDGATTGDPTAAVNATDFQELAQTLTAASGILAATTTTVFCGADPLTDTGAGSVTTVRDDVDPPGPSTGDSVTVTFNQCVRGVAPNTRTINGTDKHVLNTVTGQPYVTVPWTLNGSTATDMTTASAQATTIHKGTTKTDAGSVDGVVATRNSAGDLAHTVTPTGAAAEVTTRKFDIASTRDTNLNTFSYSVNIDSSSPRGTRKIATTTPLSGTNGAAPTAGVLSITKTDTATNSKSVVTITVNADGTVTIATDSNGDGVVDTTVTVPWTGLVGVGVNLFGGLFGGGAGPSLPIGGGTGGGFGGGTGTGGGFGGGTGTGGSFGGGTGGGFGGGTGTAPPAGTVPPTGTVPVPLTTQTAFRWW